jgi:hypothetical protein
MFLGCLNAFVKCHDPLISIQQKLAMCYVTFWKNLGKMVKKSSILLGPIGRSSPILSKMVHRNEF